MPRDYEVLDDLRDQSFSVMTRFGIDAQDAEEIASSIRDIFREHWGGSNVYFTKRKDETDRNRAICSRWDGTNMDELRADYRLTPQAIYRIIANGRKADARKRQRTPEL